MKKREIIRWAALTAAFMLLFSFMPSFAAEDQVYFTAINDELKKLDDAAMPFAYRDQYYLPLSIFDDQKLNVYYSDNRDNMTLTFYDSLLTLTFNLRTDYADDGIQTYHQMIINRNGILYVPIQFICSMFKLQFTVINTSSYPILRVVSESSLDSIDFYRSNVLKLSKEYNSYKSNNSQPSSSPRTTPNPVSPEEPRRSVYLTFDCSSGEGLTKILDALDKNGMKAAFFLTGDVIGSERDAVRRIIGTGHAIGILGRETAAEEIQRINKTLDSYTYAKTRLYRSALGTGKGGVKSDALKVLKNDGYIYWDWTVNADRYSSETTDKFASDVWSAIENADGAVVLRIVVSDKSADATPMILRHIKYNGAAVNAVTPGTDPANINK